MFYPQEMTEVELVVPEKHVLTVISFLAKYGVFHQTDTSYLSSDEGLDSARDWRSKSATYSTLEHRLLSAMRILNIREGNPPLEKLSSLAEVDVISPTTEHLEDEVQGLVNKISDEQKELESLQLFIKQLQPITDVGIDLTAFENSKYLFSSIGLMPAGNVERLKSSLMRVPFVLLTLNQNDQQSVVLLAGSKQNSDILERAARSAYLNPLNLPEKYHGTPSEILEVMYADIKRLEKHIAKKQSELAELSQARKNQFRDLLWRIRISRMMAEAMSHFGKLQYTYLAVGWVPSENYEMISQKLKQISDEILIESHVPEKGKVDRNIPVSLKNRGIFGAFQSLVTTYGKPRYEEIDPTILLAITFPLLFGAMFGDVGHGLVLTLLGILLASGKVKALGSMKSFGTIIIVCGLTAVVFGFLYGSVFGIEDLLPALWLRPMENIMTILIITVIGGVVILNLAYLINFINAWSARDWGRLLFGSTGLSGFLLYWAMIGLAASLLQKNIPLPSLPFIILAVIAGLLVTFSDLLRNLLENKRPLIEGGLATYAIQVFFELFETVISLFSNSLSYVRVGAFAVAHAGLSAVVFILADMAGSSNSIGYWIAILLGNLFIIGFEGMIVGIQTLRLEYYEFLSKFFTGGGKNFTPLKITK